MKHDSVWPYGLNEDLLGGLEAGVLRQACLFHHWPPERWRSVGECFLFVGGWVDFIRGWVDFIRGWVDFICGWVGGFYLWVGGWVGEVDAVISHPLLV